MKKKNKVKSVKIKLLKMGNVKRKPEMYLKRKVLYFLRIRYKIIVG